MPFGEARTNGKELYKFIAANQADKFWKFQSNNRQGHFSEEFKSLITTML
jgi:hypothetical protein